MPDPAQRDPRHVGPLLFFRRHDGARLHLTAVVVRPLDAPRPRLTTADESVEPRVLHRQGGLAVLGYAFGLDAGATRRYALADESWEVAVPDAATDLRLAYVSCNGKEQGDLDRPIDERNVMWQRLEQVHERQPLHLLLHGGDQLYADEMLEVHPALRTWRRGRAPRDVPVAAVTAELRQFLLERYLELFGQPATARLMAQVPSLCMWDDHDICDGWGSLPLERLDDPVGQAVFAVAREFFHLFQLGAAPDDPPPMCLDPEGGTLSWVAELPGATLVAPDLRSERRPDRVLGPAGWAALERALEPLRGRQVFVLSSVPALGPRLSWIEAVLHLVPGAQKYEDDLRDQWQSRAHREEWRRFLRLLQSVHERPDTRLAVLSGEIHLATRGVLHTDAGPLHQLTASGITHPPPPRFYATALGALARLGGTPLPSHPIRLQALPGQRSIYTTQRNYLMLERHRGRWRAWWELERDGTTPALDLDA